LKKKVNKMLKLLGIGSKKEKKKKKKVVNGPSQ